MSDEDVIIDHDPVDHPPVLTNNNTPFFWSAVNSVWKIVEGNGYFFIIGAVVAYFVYQKAVSYLEGKATKSNDVMSKLTPQQQMDRMEGMRRSRMRLQQDVDQASAVEAEKIREREERVRKEKIDDWERHVRGEGYKNKTKPAAASSSKSLKKDNYNPLMGSGTSGGSFKSSRPSRGGGGGGG